MAESGRRARGALWWLKLLVLAAVALAVAWLAVQTSTVRAFRNQPARVLLIDPGNPDTVFRVASEQLLRNRGQLPAAVEPQIAEAARREPLAAEPFLFFAMRALEQGDISRAEQLLTEARRRNPRLRLARLALLGTYLQTSRIPEASNEIAVLVRLVPRSSELLVPELSRLAAQPQSADAVVAAVGSDPLMAHVLAQLARQNVDPDHLLRLARRQPRGSADASGWQGIMLDGLVRQGQVRRAQQLWQRLVGVSAESALLYDPRFEGRPGPMPFNWTLSSSGPGVAEPAPGGALDVEYFGRDSAPLASQLLALRPGRYRLAMRVEGDAKGDGSRIEWQVSCAPSGPPLASVPLRDVSYNPRDLHMDFTVPASGCEGQWLRLQGVAAEFPATQSSRISELSLRRAGE
ncbi:MAG: tetratricopeptide repeat protein [Allosphingosinicella sp.]|uniref:tetratricopeptide repeat protein n=1 Tax=Allosphingosinicella sp. TaxID=2823234 RepID=UPI003925EC7B